MFIHIILCNYVYYLVLTFVFLNNLSIDAAIIINFKKITKVVNFFTLNMLHLNQ